MIVLQLYLCFFLELLLIGFCILTHLLICDQVLSLHDPVMADAFEVR